MEQYTAPLWGREEGHPHKYTAKFLGHARTLHWKHDQVQSHDCARILSVDVEKRHFTAAPSHHVTEDKQMLAEVISTERIEPRLAGGRSWIEAVRDSIQHGGNHLRPLTVQSHQTTHVRKYAHTRTQ